MFDLKNIYIYIIENIRVDYSLGNEYEIYEMFFFNIATIFFIIKGDDCIKVHYYCNVHILYSYTYVFIYDICICI